MVPSGKSDLLLAFIIAAFLVTFFSLAVINGSRQDEEARGYFQPCDVAEGDVVWVDRKKSRHMDVVRKGVDKFEDRLGRWWSYHHITGIQYYSDNERGCGS